MENEGCARVRTKSRIGPESHGNETFGLTLSLKVERFGEKFQHAALLLAVFALLFLLSSKLLRMADQFLEALIVGLPLRGVQFPVVLGHEAFERAVFGLANFQRLAGFSLLLIVFAIAPQGGVV